MERMLHPVSIPGIFVTGTDTGVGKTLVAGGIADWFVRQGMRVAVSKPCATGCERRREGLVSSDAEFLAHCARTVHPLDMVCPQRYAEPLAPAVAAARAGQPLDWSSIDRSIVEMTAGAAAIVVEGVGGILVPMDERHTVLDMARWLALPAIIVARAGLGTINHTLLTIRALREAGIVVAGVVINRYPPETPPVAEETNPKAISQWAKVPVVCIIPDCPSHNPGAGTLPKDVVASLSAIDWLAIAQTRQE
jgi:dethiobiotin synthetase